MSKAIKFKNKNNEAIYPCPFYPIGSIYVSTSSINPSTYFGGNWECIYSDYDYLYMGSQVVHQGIETENVSANSSKKIVLQGAYTSQFLSLQSNLNCPSGYVFKYRWTMEVTTNGDINCQLRINDRQVTNSICTWSGEQFRQTSAGGFYELGKDILPKSTTDIGYSSNGYVYSIYAVNNATKLQSIRVWDITAHLYAVSKNIIYKWRRIS